MEPKCGMWHIQGTVTSFREDGKWACTKQIPTFYIHPEVQGCDSEKCAKNVAQRILSMGTSRRDRISVSATLVSVESVVKD